MASLPRDKRAHCPADSRSWIKISACARRIFHALSFVPRGRLGGANLFSSARKYSIGERERGYENIESCGDFFRAVSSRADKFPGDGYARACRTFLFKEMDARRCGPESDVNFRNPVRGFGKVHGIGTFLELI